MKPLCKKLSLRDVDVTDKRILMRAEFNLPMEDGKITSNHRLVSTIPTIRFCIDNGAKSVVIMSHMGKPGRQVSLKPVAEELERLLNRPVIFLTSCIGPEVDQVCSTAKKGSIILLENVRFHIEETGLRVDHNGNETFANENDVIKFRQRLSKLGDIFVNDAFGVIQRNHSSMAGINLEIRAAGLLMEKEIKFFTKLLKDPERPFALILGGAKVIDKIALVEKLLDIIDELIIGGGMAFTFLKVINNMEIGKSLFDEKGEKYVKQIMEKVKKKNVKFHLPFDFIASNSLANEGHCNLVQMSTGIPSDMMGLDCGPETTSYFTRVLQNAKTVFWNGPLGVFEKEQFSNGTKNLLCSLADLTKKSATIVIGGGDTVSACIKFGRAEDFTHVSTGGGASIAFLEGRHLPGISNLCDALE